MNVLAIIPARYASKRLPGKPLALIGGKPMIQHVYESASRVPGLARVVVATDDRRIMKAVCSFGGEAVLTSHRHPSGTDRLAEVARKIHAGWVVNIQGDLPFFRPQTVARPVRALLRDPAILMGTVRTPIRDPGELANPNVVKVVTDAGGFALYFSRAPIPYRRNYNGRRVRSGGIWGYRHLGIYVYRRDFLLRLSRLRPVALEEAEGLEQLRVLAHGFRIRVVDIEEPGVEVDTAEDLLKVESRFAGALRIRA